jgi:hypothetical protein
MHLKKERNGSSPLKEENWRNSSIHESTRKQTDIQMGWELQEKEADAPIQKPDTVLQVLLVRVDRTNLGHKRVQFFCLEGKFSVLPEGHELGGQKDLDFYLHFRSWRWAPGKEFNLFTFPSSRPKMGLSLTPSHQGCGEDQRM